MALSRHDCQRIAANGTVQTYAEPLVPVDFHSFGLLARRHVPALHERFFHLVHGSAVQVVANKAGAGRSVLQLIGFVLLFQFLHRDTACCGNLLPNPAVGGVVLVCDTEPAHVGVLIALQLLVELEQETVTVAASGRDTDSEGVPHLRLTGRASFPNSIVAPDVNLIADENVEVLTLQRRFLVGVDVYLLTRLLVADNVLVDLPLCVECPVRLDDGGDIALDHGGILFGICHDAVLTVRDSVHGCDSQNQARRQLRLTECAVDSNKGAAILPPKLARFLVNLTSAEQRSPDVFHEPFGDLVWATA